MATKFLDLAGVTYLWSKITGKFVAKEDGKGLSTNDFTTDEKNKLSGLSNYTHPNHTSHESGLYLITVDDKGHVTGATSVTKDDITALGIPSTNTTYNVASATSNGLMSKDNFAKLKNIETGAQVNVIESIKVNGTAQTITSKGVDITVPTKTSGLTNDSGFQTSDDVTTAINNAIKDITSFNYSVVTELPTTGVKGTIYLLSNGGSTPNSYDEYIWVGDKFEKIGTTELDLSGYLKTTDVTEITNAEIDIICG